VPANYSLDHNGSLITRNESEVYESEIALVDAQAEVSNVGKEAMAPHLGRGKRTRVPRTLCMTNFGRTNSRRLFSFLHVFFVCHKITLLLQIWCDGHTKWFRFVVEWDM
jgi:hypothetical protein